MAVDEFQPAIGQFVGEQRTREADLRVERGQRFPLRPLCVRGFNSCGSRSPARMRT